uniref:Uncharacterized protein n=1 Tax=Setaria italica TaxID=4555 RepID=K3Y3S6_SETIT
MAPPELAGMRGGWDHAPQAAAASVSRICVVIITLVFLSVMCLYYHQMENFLGLLLSVWVNQSSMRVSCRSILSSFSRHAAASIGLVFQKLLGSFP